MFEQVRNSKTFVRVVLALIVLPFALWGVDSYVSSDGAGNVATVGEAPISLGEFQQALREKQDQLRPQLGDANPELLESPELRRGVLDELINRRLLALHAHEARLSVSDESLAGFITAVPALQENGQFSRERYQALVAAQGMTVEMFEAQVRQDLLLQQSMIAAGNAAVGGRVPADRWLAAQLEEREIREFVLRAEQFAAAAKPDAAAIERYYTENRTRFEIPEQIRVEYVVLSQDKLVENARVGDEEAQAWYRANEARYAQPEQRQASHILIRLEKGAPEAAVSAAEAKAREILAQLKANPADFAKLAARHSEDPGSADKGGDLGLFGRGMMVKPFEDAVFSLKENELSDVVRSDFGFHLIKLTGIRPGQVRPFAEVRGEIVAELKRQAGTRQFAVAAEDFGNMVYEQADTLAPVAEKFGLTLQSSDWLARRGQAEAPLTNPKLLSALFSDDAIKAKRNTPAIDVAASTLVSARVIEHRPATVEPLEALAGLIETLLAQETAAAQAAAAGQAQLEKLVKGEAVDVPWGAARSVSRMHAPNLSGEARTAIFGAPGKVLPAYVGAKVPAGFALYRIDKVKPYDAAAGEEAAARGQALRQHYEQVVAQEDLVGWLAALRQRYPVTINAAALERK
jgi:peptidyl-prolyl cis-trans isomerase D